MRLSTVNALQNSNITASFIEEFGDRNAELPEIKMWKMVLHRAIWDYKHFWELPTREKHFLAKQAQIWIRKPGKLDNPSMGSCAWVCMHCFPEHYPLCLNQLIKEVAQELPPVHTLKGTRVTEYWRKKAKEYIC